MTHAQCIISFSLGAGSGIIKNRRYEPLPLKDLIDPSMSNWCHHARYLLRQGRVKWLAPGKADGEGEVNTEKVTPLKLAVVLVRSKSTLSIAHSMRPTCPYLPRGN